MIGRVTYAGVFCVLVPLGLAWWAARLEPSVGLPAWRWPLVGMGLCVSGAAMIASAWWALWQRGGGLPMNAYPPRRRVESGVYALTSDPIYLGAVLVSAGAALWTGSAAGLWVVTPVLALGCAALVLGYERDATLARLGEPARTAWLGVPPGDDADATWRERTGAAAVVFIPWVIAYELIGHVPVRRAWSGWLPGESDLPVFTWAEPLYASAYLVVPAAYLLLRTRRDVRWFAIVGWVGTLVGMLLYVSVPVVTPPRAFESVGMLGWMLEMERADGLEGRAALPSFHVFWTVVAGVALARRFPRWRALVWVWVVMAIGACWGTGMHSVLDIAAGVAFGVGVLRWRWWRDRALAFAERVANSWREWRLGPVRVINHGLYAGLAAGVGVLLTSMVAPDALPVLAVTGVCALVGAALVGQALVGKAGSGRPFGYFGSVVGAALAMSVAGALGWADWRLAAGLAAAAPWVQAIGRLRCLVQGCCHGRACEGGIVYRHPRSRVCRLTDLGGRPVHPTPLYSMLGNAVLGIVLARLCVDGAAAPIVVGAYAIGAGLLRFVEEHRRGEPLTPVRGGLRIYQWFSALSVLAGIVVSGAFTAPGVTVIAPPAGAWVWAASVGAAYGLAMGVDFPRSSRRFARLA